MDEKNKTTTTTEKPHKSTNMLHIGKKFRKQNAY